MVMSQFIAYLMVVVVCLSSKPGSVIVISSQGQEIDIKLLDRGIVISSVPQWRKLIERARNEVHQIIAILATTGQLHTCNGTPGWRRVAFINMTDTS